MISMYFKVLSLKILIIMNQKNNFKLKARITLNLAAVVLMNQYRNISLHRWLNNNQSNTMGKTIMTMKFLPKMILWLNIRIKMRTTLLQVFKMFAGISLMMGKKTPEYSMSQVKDVYQRILWPRTVTKNWSSHRHNLHKEIM